MGSLEKTYGDIGFTGWADVGEKLGGRSVVDGIRSQTLAVVRDSQTVRVQEAEGAFFDRHGRLIPPRGLQLSVQDANYDFHLIRPEKLDPTERIQRTCEHLRVKKFMTPAEFEDRAGKILELILGDERSANIVRGDRACPLPFCLSQQNIPQKQYGKVMRSFAEGAGWGYRSQFPMRTFNDYLGDQLDGETHVIGGLGHERFLAALAKGNVVGVYFPTALQGYSPFAQRAMMAFLPPMFCLGGGIDTLTVLTAWPDVLARDFNTPGLDMSALQWQSAESSLFFRAHDGEADFDRRGDLGDASDHYSGGLVVLG